MKTISKCLFAAGVLALVATGCNTEKPVDKLGKGEKSAVTLTIHNEVAPGVRSSAGVTDVASTEESAVVSGTGLKVAVFNEDGTLDYSSGATNISLSPNAPYVSGQFSVTSGNKYFFVFANDAATSGKIVMPTAGTTMDQFIKQNIAVAQAATDIATNGSFLLGTLWAERSFVNGGGTTTTPVNVPLTIGRLSSKVCVKMGSSVTTDRAGAFSDVEFRLGATPKKIYAVGIHAGNALPTAAAGVLVTSAVHTAVPYTGASDANFYEFSGTAFNVAGTSVYTAENTTALDATGRQFFGNTTYVQIASKYTPDATEVVNPADLSQGALAANGDFWIGYKLDGTKLLFSSLPVNGTDSNQIDYARGFDAYIGGVNYHKFAVYDKNEASANGGLIHRNRVLRNHYYEFTVTKFLDLGSPTSVVNPQEPIDSPTTITVTVTVKNWDKVSDNLIVK